MENTFTDLSHINVKGGDGGAGCMSFRREAFDADLIETQPTTEEDLEAIFAGLFDE